MSDFLNDVYREVIRARQKFPSPEGLMAALTEEVGEVAKAVLDEPWPNVYGECVQAAAMALRLAEERDQTLSQVRARRGADGLLG